jgi:AcrR family transcriptional regulator
LFYDQITGGERLNNTSMKELIASAAITIVAKEGIEGLSAKKIADYLSISKSNVFHHYPSLDLLKETMLTDLQSQLLSWSPDIFTEIEDLQHILQKLFNHLAEMNNEVKIGYVVLLQFHTACLYESNYRTHFLQAKKSALRDMVTILSKYSPAEPSIIELVAESIIMAMDGIGLHYLLEADEPTARRIWDMFCTTWLNQLTVENRSN